jgi:hypothetical protein
MGTLAQGQETEHSPATADMLEDVPRRAGLGKEITLLKAFAQIVWLMAGRVHALTFW